MVKSSQHILIVTTLAFLVLVTALLYWQIFEAPRLLARPDNPRPHREQVEMLSVEK